MSNINYHLQHKRETPYNSITKSAMIGLILLFLTPLIVISILLGVIYSAFVEIYLRLKFLAVVVSQKKFVLFIYSDSPVWKSYIENNILAQIQNQSIILNWSNRNKWSKLSWTVQSFKYWGGEKNFNPLAIVFCNFTKIKVFRFYTAFHDYKHGKVDSLQKIESQFLGLVKSKTRPELR